MKTRRDFLKLSGMALAGVAVGNNILAADAKKEVVSSYTCKRPLPAERCFTSRAIEKKIAEIKPLIKNQKLAWMFENCFPNTLDTTVTFKMTDGKPDTFVITGDIHAMWLRDSSAQVFPYLAFAPADPQLQLLIEGVIRRQTSQILLDPYANAFNDGPVGSKWNTDGTSKTIPDVYERKWEIDSLCYPVRLAYYYWKITGDRSVFDKQWQEAAALIVQTFKEQQRKESLGPYYFYRVTDRQGDTQLNRGYGSPVNPVGLICSSFRPSDDATLLNFLIPSNLFAVESLRQLAEISLEVTHDGAFAEQCAALADEVEQAVQKYGIVSHPVVGRVYAFEVDGFGNHICMDDANVPSLLALPYLCSFIKKDDPLYLNTRRLAWSHNNPYFYSGKAGEGIGGPHVSFDNIWPMSIIIKAMTSCDDSEIKRCMESLVATDGGTGFMHETFHKDDAATFTRSWFAWANTLFGELVLNQVERNTDITSF